MAILLGGGGGGASSSSSAAEHGETQAQQQEIGLTLWKHAHLQAWQAILEVAVRQLLSPRHPLHAQMAQDDPDSRWGAGRGTELFKCDIFTVAAEHAVMEVVAQYGAAMTSLIKLQKDAGSGYSSRILGVLVEHAGLQGQQRAAHMLELKTWTAQGRAPLFRVPGPEILAKIAAERPRWSQGVLLKKLQAELRSANLLVDGLAALAGHADDLHVPNLMPNGYISRGDISERWQKATRGCAFFGAGSDADFYGDAFKLLRWPICGALHCDVDGGHRERIELRSEPSEDIPKVRLWVRGKSSDGKLTGGGEQVLGEQLDAQQRLTLPSAGQLVVNECALALLALRATNSKVGPASAVHRALVQLTLPRTDVEAFDRLEDPAGAGLRAHLWQHRRPFFLVRMRTPESVLGRLPGDLFELVLKDFIGTGYTAALYL